MKLLIGVLIILLANTSAAFTTNVFLGKKLCTNNDNLCVKGSMEMDLKNNKLIFTGRVKKTVGKGILTIIMYSSETGIIELKKEIKGKYSEIIKLESNKFYKAKRFTKWSIQETYYKTFK